MPTDPYALLGLSKSATAADIKQAYRKLARSSHPDLNLDDAGAEARFKAISAAHDLLKDPATRARFDAGEIDDTGAERPPRQYYRDFAEDPSHAYPPRGGFRSSFADGDDPNDIFAEILRQRGAAAGGFTGQGFAGPGRDLRFALEVPFLDAARGAEMRLSLGNGDDFSVKIPPGAQDGQTLRLRGKGEAGSGGGRAGDALITLSVRPHRVFRREGDDILVILPITIDEAIIGGKVTAPTITGPVNLTIPPGASSGRILRLRGRGVSRADAKGMGDQLVELRIVAPPETDTDLRDFLTDWRKSHPHDPRTTLLDEAAS